MPIKYIGDVWKLSWSNLQSSTVTIKYTRDGSNYTDITTTAPNTEESGSYDWTINIYPCESLIVRVVDNDDPAYYLDTDATKITSRYAAQKTIKANPNYATVNNFPYMFDLSKLSAGWWSRVTGAGDIVIYNPATGLLLPRHVCSSFSIANKSGWITADCPVSASADKIYEIHVIPGYGSVNAASAHTNSGCFSAYGFDEASGTIFDKTGNRNITATAITYAQTGTVCKSIAVTTSSSVNSGACPEVLSATKFSVSFLTKVSDVAANRFLFSKYVSANTHVRIYLDTSRRIVVAYRNVTTNTSTADTSAVLQLNTWMHIHVSYDYAAGATDADRLKIYLNGTNYAWTGGVLPTSLTNLAGNVYFGTTSDSAPYSGNHDEIRMYSKMLIGGEQFIEYKNWLDYDNAVETKMLNAGLSTRPQLSNLNILSNLINL